MILTVGTDEDLRDRVARSLQDTEWATTVGTVASVGEAQELLRAATPPRVVVVGRSVGVDGAADVAATAAGLRVPPVVLLVGTPTTTLLRQAMRAGVRDVLPVGFGPEDLVTALRDAGVMTGGPDPVPGLTVAVFSTKGGVGTSVIASNLAVLLAERTGLGTVLVDLDLASADQSIMHGVSPKWTVQDLADGSVGLDAESLQQVLLGVQGSSSTLLPGPVDPALAETISGADVGSVVGAVRAERPIAVLDTSSAFDDRTLTALDAADVTVIVSSLDVGALRSLSVSLQTLERLGRRPTDLLVALNRAGSKSGLVVADVERTINRTVDVGIPSMRSVPRSVNEGVPLAVSSPRSPVVAALGDLVELLVARLPDDVELGGQKSTGARLHLPWRRGSKQASADHRPAASPTPAAPAPAPGSEVPPPPAPADSGAEAAEHAGVSSAEGDNVRPIRVRVTGAGRSGRRKVRRDDGSEGSVMEDVADDGSTVDAPAPGEEPAIRAVPGLDELPPPAVLPDSEDDQPRRRRRR